MADGEHPDVEPALDRGPIDPDLPLEASDALPPDATYDPQAVRTPAPGTSASSARRHDRQWDVAVAIGLGGAVGGGARWLVNAWLPSTGLGFPWATFLENATGALLLGILMVFALDVWPPTRYVRPFLTTGLMGGFTTFSAYALDMQQLTRNGHAAVAALYGGATIAVGLMAAFAGLRVARWAVQRQRREA